EQGGGVGFEGGELSPVKPVVRLESAVKAHGGDVAVAASVAAVAGRGQRVGEAGMGEVAGGFAEDAFRVRLEDSEGRHRIIKAKGKRQKAKVWREVQRASLGVRQKLKGGFRFGRRSGKRKKVGARLTKIAESSFNPKAMEAGSRTAR